MSWYWPQCYTRRYIHDGSFFSKSKITLQKWMILLNFWVHKYPVTDAMQEAEVDGHTAIHAYQWLRDICSSCLMRGQIVLGGPDVDVHIDESLFRHKPKVCTHTHVCSLTEVRHIAYFTPEQLQSSYNTRGLGVRDGRHLNIPSFG